MNHEEHSESILDLRKQAKKPLPPGPVLASSLPSTEMRDPVPDFEESADLRDYLDVILRRKWLILTLLLVVFVTVLIMTLSMQPIFKAKARLELSPAAPKVTKFEEVLVTESGSQEYIQTQVELLKSRTLAARVIERLHLHENAVFNPQADPKNQKPGLLGTWKQTLKEWLRFNREEDKEQGQAGNPELQEIRTRKGLQEKFTANLEVTPQRDTDIVNLAFSSLDPALCRDVLNASIQEFISWQMDKKMDAAKSAKTQLDKQVEEARIQLERSEKELNNYARKAGIVSLDSNLNLVYRQLEEINKTLAGVEAERINKEALYRQVKSGKIDSVPAVLENTLIQELRSEYIKLLGSYQELHAMFKDDYPTVKNLKAKMEDIKEKLTLEEERILNSIIDDYLGTLDREEFLREKAKEKEEAAMALNDRATQYKMLEREVDTNKQIHQSLLERAKEIDANVGTDLGNILVVDYAVMPISPYKPNVRRNLLLAIIVGLVMGIGVAFFLEYLDNTVKRVEEISDRHQIPVLGVVPMAEKEDQKDLARMISTRPKAGFSEAVRTASVSIQLCGFDDPLKSLLVTSTAQGQGKTTLATSLARAFASSEEQVLLLDCDFRKPGLHKTFEINGKPKGLSQYLSGLYKFEEVVHPTNQKTLHVIPAGPIPPNPVELLSSKRMRLFLQGLQEHFDRIVLDSPPFGGFADVLVLSNQVDGVILVTTLGETHRDALRIFRKSLANVKGRLLGSLVNKAQITHRYGGYYYSYYKYYHQYYYGDEGKQDALIKETRDDLQLPNPEA